MTWPFRYGMMLLGWFVAWIAFALIYGQINDIGNTYVSSLGLVAPILLVPAFYLVDARRNAQQRNEATALGFAWFFGASGYLLLVLLLSAVSKLVAS